MSFHSGQTFTFGETPSATKWNYLWENDYALADGTGISDNAIINRHITEGVVSLKKLNADVAFLAYMHNAQNTTNGTSKVQLSSESYDQGSNFDNATNYRFVAPVNGVYHFDGGIRTSNASAIRLIAVLYKNGAIVREGVSQAADSFTSSLVSTDIKLAANDYIELYVTSNSTNAMAVDSSGDLLTYMSGHLVGEY